MNLLKERMKKKYFLGKIAIVIKRNAIVINRNATIAKKIMFFVKKRYIKKRRMQKNKGGISKDNLLKTLAKFSDLNIYLTLSIQISSDSACCL